jgi:chemotaxis protein CheX
MSEIAGEEALPVSPEVQEQLLDPFIAATRAALSEMTAADVMTRGTWLCPANPEFGDISVVLRLTSAREEFLVLSFPERTAAELARRMLTGVSTDLDGQLIRDCLAEIGNVVAGQAKALLGGTPYQFSFSLPRIALGADCLALPQNCDCHAIAFSGEVGEFAVQVFLKR